MMRVVGLFFVFIFICQQASSQDNLPSTIGNYRLYSIKELIPNSLQIVKKGHGWKKNLYLAGEATVMLPSGVNFDPELSSVLVARKFDTRFNQVGLNVELLYKHTGFSLASTHGIFYANIRFEVLLEKEHLPSSNITVSERNRNLTLFRKYDVEILPSETSSYEIIIKDVK